MELEELKVQCKEAARHSFSSVACIAPKTILALIAQLETVTQERDDARLAAEMHLKTVQCQGACLHPVVGQALGPHYDAPKTRLDIISLIHSQMHRVYASALDRDEVDTKYMAEIENAIMEIYHGRYIAGYDLRKSEESRQPAIAPAATPAGWVLVPVEPTNEMANIGGHVNSEYLNDFAPIGESRYKLPIATIWSEMLKAAPTPPASPSPDQ